MLSRLIVQLYPWIIEIYLWFALLVAGAIGSAFSVLCHIHPQFILRRIAHV